MVTGVKQIAQDSGCYGLQQARFEICQLSREPQLHTPNWLLTPHAESTRQQLSRDQHVCVVLVDGRCQQSVA